MDVSSPELAHRARRHVELARFRVDELRTMYEQLGGLTTAGWRKDEIITAIIDTEVYRSAH